MTSRYPDNRYPPRDRTPPRYGDRRPSAAPPYGNSYTPRNTESGGRPVDSGNGFPPSSRDVPRGPKSLDPPRGPGVGSGPGVPSGPRGPGGRGFTRELRDAPPLSEPLGRWRATDRDRDFRDRRPSPRPRSPIRDSRDYHGPTQVDIGRARRNSRDGPLSAGSNFSDPPLSSQPYRGGFRGRGRGGPDWDFRGRGRPPFDDRDQREQFRPRSRSRGPPLRREREPLRDDRDMDRRDDRRYDRNEEPRPRVWDSYKGPASTADSRNVEPRHVPPATESRHAPSGSTSAGPPFPAPYSGISTHRSVGDRSDPPRDDLYSRRSSIATDTLGPKESRRESDKPDFLAGRAEASRDRYGPRAASPAPQVPAFGSVSARPPTYPAQASNVWRNPNLDKPAQSALGSKPVPSASAAVSTPTPPIPSPSSTISKAPPPVPSGLTAFPPTGPKAQRAPDRPIIENKDTRPPNVDQSRLDPPSRIPAGTINPPTVPAESVELKSSLLTQAASPAVGVTPQMRAPPTGPQGGLRPNVSPSQPYARTPQTPLPPRDASPNALPIGPRGPALMNTSPKSVGANIPTGPRAERSQVIGARPPIYGTPDRPAFAPQRNTWIRPGAMPFNNRPATIPTKREFAGDERDRMSGNVPKAPRMEGSTSAADSRPWESSKPELPPADQFKADTQRQIDSAPGPRPQQASPKVQQIETRRLSDVSMTDASPYTDRPPVSATSSVPDPMAEESENEIDLDEADFAEVQAKFNKDKAALEAKLIDLSASEYRAVSLLEEISLLSVVASIPIEQLSISGPQTTEVRMASPEPPAELSGPTQQEPITPKADQVADADNSEVIEDSREVPVPEARILRPQRSYSLDPGYTPDINTLPYLPDGEGPPTPVSELDLDQFAPTEDVAQAVHDVLQDFEETEMQNQETAEDEYARAYKEWRHRIQELDDAKERESEARDQSIEPALKATTPDATAANTVVNMLEQPIRRGHRFNSEYDLQLALKESMKDAEEAQARKERDAKKSAPDPEREAAIWDQWSPYEAQRRMFTDTNWQRQPGQGINVFHYDPQPDDFTDEEHRILVENYHDMYLKKWGKLAEILTEKTGKPRDYKECINHYYSTKWSKEYKGRRKYRKGRKRGGGAAGRGRASAANTDRPDLFTDDIVDKSSQSHLNMTTDSGRPRRAAAPTFGAESEVDGVTPAPTPARARGAGRQDNGEGTGEKAGKRQKVAKEKGGRKAKNQPPLIAVSAGSPIKIDRKEKLLGVKTEDAYGRERSIEESRMLSNIQPGPGMDDHIAYQEEMLARNGPSGILNDRPRIQTAHSRGGPSSYWSVMEQTDFKRNVAHFGTDFVAIANHMGTKTHTMVKNQYQRLVEQGNAPELLQAAQEADQRKHDGADLGPPPTPTPAVKRRYDQPQTTVPRTIAPTPDVVDLLNSPVLQPAIPTQASPPMFPASTRYSAIAQAAPVQTKQSAQSPPSEAAPHIVHQPQPPPQPAPAHQQHHHHHHAQHQPQRPSLSGPRAGYFSDTRAEARPQSQSSSIPQPTRSIPHVQDHLHRQQPSQDSTYRQSIHPQDREMQSRFESQQERDHQSRYQAQQHSRRISQEIAQQRQYQAHATSTAQIMSQLRSDHAGHGSPESRALSLQPNPMYPPQQQQQQQQPSIMQHLIDSPNPAASSMAHHMPSRQSVPTPPPKEEPRPYSMPPQLPPSQPAPPVPRPAQEVRKSNLMSILNPEPSEPEEPRPRKKLSDQGGSSHTPTPLQNHPIAPPPSVSQPPRREPYGDHAASQPPFSRIQYGQQQPQPQPSSRPRIVDLTGRDPAPSTRPRQSWPPRQDFQPPHTQGQTTPQTSSPHPSHPQPSIITDSSLFPNHRAQAFSQHNTGRHVPSPPPVFTHSPHSRNSSFTHIPPPQSRHQTPLQAAQAGAGAAAAQILAPNPYGQIDPPGSTPQPQGPGGMRPSPHLLTSQLQQQQQQQRELQARQEEAQRAQHHNAAYSYSNPQTPSDAHPPHGGHPRDIVEDMKLEALNHKRLKYRMMEEKVLQEQQEHEDLLRQQRMRGGRLPPPPPAVDPRFGHAQHTPGPPEMRGGGYAAPPLQPPRTSTPLGMAHHPLHHQQQQQQPQHGHHQHSLSQGGLVVDHNHVILRHADEQARYREREREREEMARREEQRIREETLRREELYRVARGQGGVGPGGGPMDWTRGLPGRGEGR
ncbi:hypothetical protein BU16DRAFT_568195 [Lophium mytilinum]|uniref:Myb-like domain-containing protein n=1 Tax=Lophium mytilinum TaxID=390894 RepID=A0A6A6Q8A2_9PEZI|nr:hypothetical protein BU16DRAFT_568195 [Lophium mytilinum]